MSSDGFTVDLDALAAARDRVGRLAAELAKPSRGVPNAEVFGHEGLHKAVNEFAVREKRGLALLARETESIHQGLAETIKTYQETDEDVAGRFREIES